MTPFDWGWGGGLRALVAMTGRCVGVGMGGIRRTAACVVVCVQADLLRWWWWAVV